ncbi:MAG: hypothetical protein IJQ68_01680 [Methanobrevibacter sp.]|uniref:hypothetical protein n=1 Tax=Methanobrevibacter sp. TaxID=66852 RepID=UPI0025D31972|nr:hypothetical protein [Methanobrevibacter sp.]MBR0270691.1 hypothetical protein [Methanobrevibacter sp.]
MISLRKINTLLVVVIAAMLLIHGLMSLLFLYGITAYSPDFKITGRRLFYPVAAHIIISLYLYFKDKSGTLKKYADLNSDTLRQMISGIFIIIFAALHIVGYSIGSVTDIDLYHFIVDTLLFASIAVHLNVSVPKFMISLGFLEAKDAHSNFKRKIKYAVMIIFIICVLAELRYYIGGMLW